jgi:Domain of unknown function (DUF5655)
MDREKVMKFIKPEKLWLKAHPELNEKWVQEEIAKDPQILGLGELILKDKERIQPKAGRLDLLLQDAESNRRYEVEIQLGRTDERHIIRTIEYWDLERKRFPQYDHCAVIIAEDITSRFFNVIGLFNGNIPLIAIQMNAIKFEDSVALIFTTVLDEVTFGLDEDDEEAEVTDRPYWESKGTSKTLAIADSLLKKIHTFAPDLEFKYNKFYIGLAKNGHPCNFIVFRTKKKFLRIDVRLKQAEEIQKMLDDSNLDVMDYEKRYGRYRIKITHDELSENEELLFKIMKMAYDNFI